MALSTKDIAWVAGLLEGEGCFSDRKTGRGCPLIQLMMTDKDIVIRAAQILGANRVVETKNPCKSGKRLYRFALFGQRAVGWCMTLFPIMGERRQARIIELLEAWKAAPAAKYLRRRCISRGGKQVWVNERFVNVSA